MTKYDERTPHPLMVWNRRDKIKAKVGTMLLDLVKDVKPNGGYEYSGIKELCLQYKLHPYTLHKYLGERIEEDHEASYKKKLVLSRNEVIATRQIAHLLGQYTALKTKEKNYIKFLFSAAGKTL